MEKERVGNKWADAVMAYGEATDQTRRHTQRTKWYPARSLSVVRAGVKADAALSLPKHPLTPGKPHSPSICKIFFCWLLKILHPLRLHKSISESFIFPNLLASWISVPQNHFCSCSFSITTFQMQTLLSHHWALSHLTQAEDVPSHSSTFFS